MRLRTFDRLLITSLLVAVAFAGWIAVSPLLKMSRTINARKNWIIHELDHAAIRDAAMTLLTSGTVDSRVVSRDELPIDISRTEPNWVSLDGGTMVIEYGGGFAHFGLIIDPKNDCPHDATRLTDCVYFYETE